MRWMPWVPGADSTLPSWSWRVHLSVVSDSATPRTVSSQPPLSRGFSRQEHWSALPLPSPGDLPDPGSEFWPPHGITRKASGMFLLQDRQLEHFFTSSAPHGLKAARGPGRAALPSASGLLRRRQGHAALGLALSSGAPDPSPQGRGLSQRRVTQECGLGARDIAQPRVKAERPVNQRPFNTLSAIRQRSNL